MCMLLSNWRCELLRRAVFGSGGLKALQGAILMWNTIVSGNQAAEGAGIQACFWPSLKVIELSIAPNCAVAHSRLADHSFSVTASA